MNEMIPFERYDIESLTPEQMDILQSKLMARQIRLLNQEIGLVKEEQKVQRAELEIVKAEQQKTIEVAANSLRVQQGRFEYVNQGDFGRFFSVSISSVDVGKLLRLVGLALPSRKGATIPFRDKIPKYAQVTANAKYSVVQWHYERCMERIDEWLDGKGEYERFYSIQTEPEIKQFINNLYEIHMP